MPLQIFPRETNWGESLGGGLGRGLSSGMQALANMKMQEYAQRQQAAKNEAFFNTLPGMTPEKAKAWSDAPLGLQQTGLKELMNAPRKEAFSTGLGLINKLGQPGQASDIDQQQLQEALSKMNAEDQYKTMQLINQQEANKINAAEKLEKSQRANKELELQESNKITPFIKTEQTTSSIIGDVGKDARRIKQILMRHKKDWPNWISGLIQGAAGGKLTFNPEMREFYKLTSALPVKLGNALKGQPTNMKIKLVAEGKPDISSPWQTNMDLVQTLIDADEENKKRTLFRIKQKKNDKYPVDIDQRMADYDAAVNSPEEYPEFFEKYPRFKPKNMAQPSAPKAAPEVKVGAKLDKLPAASEYPGMEGMWNGKKVKSDGKSWRAV
jgi:hypothetical protein